MRSISLLIIFSVSTLSSFIIQDCLPPLNGLQPTHILLTPILFTYGALSLPFSAMLVLAAFTGFFTDLSTFQVVSGTIEIGIGWSILAYSVLGALVQHVRDKTLLRGVWWLHPFLSAVCTFSLLSFHYIAIALHRDGIIFNTTVVWKVCLPAMIAFLLSPVIGVPFAVLETTLFPRKQTGQKP
ncbi:hypothetical protein AMD24_00638 [Candidatus Xiphinematobacter sp. Idaho Grape]|uniref:hypothetical protein n=1 Tax=Candidatus Xiphinematobacter sp. Idaho Grape TaxID=1704307 RepID=UPI00070662F6|nr:hypothetical protein [Candidatus Xiphinematobacter sp. Idaho Grape]ALJ56804.1 hypothetical protein AMD24_00638 [Candidatus Xiphinematobacter sp. Idaho Grape]